MLEIYTGAEDCPKCGGTKPIKMECPWCAIKTLESERDQACARVAELEAGIRRHYEAATADDGTDMGEEDAILHRLVITP